MRAWLPAQHQASSKSLLICAIARSPLHDAAEAGDVELLRELLLRQTTEAGLPC